MSLYSYGRYDEVIDRVNRILSETDTQDNHLQYLRGAAEYKICWLAAAKTDLESLGDFRIDDQWPTAASLVLKIEALRAASPKNVHEVRCAGDVVFRVYSDDNNTWSSAIIKLLPEAFQIGRKLFDSKVIETPVFIFKDSARYANFCKLRFDNYHLASWEWAYGAFGLFVFCETNPQGAKPAEDTDGDYFRGTVVHEYTHTLIFRTLGTASLPTWMSEGIAEFAATKIAPRKIAKNTEAMRVCAEANVLLGLDTLNDETLFYGSYEIKMAEDRLLPLGNRKIRSNCYEQSLNMVRYIMKYAGMRGFDRFINDYASSEDLNASFQDGIGKTMPEFYDLWKRVGRQQFETTSK